MQPKDFKEYFFSDVWKEELYLDQTEETPDKTEIRKRYQEEKRKSKGKWDHD